MASSAPDDLIAVGRIEAAYGIRGAIRVVPFGDADALIDVEHWWVGPENGPAVPVRRTQARRHGKVVVAQLEGMADRDLAEALRGQQVAVERSRFPALGADERYWVDLIGSEVFDLEGRRRGTVADMSDNGAHAILEIDRDDGVHESVPWVEAYVREDDAAHRRLVLDWAWEEKG